MMGVTYKHFGQLSFGDLEVYSVLPEHPIWSKVVEYIDFQFADRICAPLYSTRGPRPYAPSLKLKLHIVQRYYNLSDREMEERVIGDLFIKWFLGLPVRFIGFDHSMIGLDRDRVGSELFNACHHHILAKPRRKVCGAITKTFGWLIPFTRTVMSQGNRPTGSSSKPFFDCSTISNALTARFFANLRKIMTGRH